VTDAGFRVKTIELDLPAVAAALNRRLHEAGVPTTAERAARFAQALELVRPVSRRRLYWTARAVFVSDQAQLRTFDGVFRSVFSGPEASSFEPEDAQAVAEATEVGAPDRRAVRGNTEDGDRINPVPIGPSGPPDDDGPEPERELPVPMSPSDEEVLRGKRFDALEPAELAQLYRLMARLRVATPGRRTRRARRDRRGEQLDMRRTLRGSMRTAGDPIRLAHRRRRVVPRRMVLLCDISGSMEPYARAYLQFLTSAAGSGPNVEVFAFATRLTRLTRALRSRSPERAIQRAAAVAPDWSSGTRIGDALKSFNDRHGRRGMARGAILVILSDGWERGDPALVGREMERLSRLAHRIVWVNPRVAATGFSPRAGGMAAALPWCDAVLSGHSLDALGEVVKAIAARDGDRINPVPIAPAAPEEPDDDPWPSATPVAGSSVAMPSGYGPGRGRTTPGWGPNGDE
jgi:uncharacterized protein with von Willebrand factor type A (vWA) domain